MPLKCSCLIQLYLSFLCKYLWNLPPISEWKWFQSKGTFTQQQCVKNRNCSHAGDKIVKNIKTLSLNWSILQIVYCIFSVVLFLLCTALHMVWGPTSRKHFSNSLVLIDIMRFPSALVLRRLLHRWALQNPVKSCWVYAGVLSWHTSRAGHVGVLGVPGSWGSLVPFQMPSACRNAGDSQDSLCLRPQPHVWWDESCSYST